MIINFIFITPHIFPYENTKVKVSTELGRVRRWHIKKRYYVPSVVSSSKWPSHWLAWEFWVLSNVCTIETKCFGWYWYVKVLVI